LGEAISFVDEEDCFGRKTTALAMTGKLFKLVLTKTIYLCFFVIFLRALRV